MLHGWLREFMRYASHTQKQIVSISIGHTPFFFFLATQFIPQRTCKSILCEYCVSIYIYIFIYGYMDISIFGTVVCDTIIELCPLVILLLLLFSCMSLIDFHITLLIPCNSLNDYSDGRLVLFTWTESTHAYKSRIACNRFDAKILIISSIWLFCLLLLKFP